MSSLARMFGIGFLLLATPALLLRSVFAVQPGSGAEEFGVSWHSLGPVLLEGRAHLTATPLPGAAILVVGGTDADENPLASAEMLDTARGTSVATSPLHHGYAYHTATALRDGRVLIAGGLDENHAYSAHAEVFDPQTAAWTVVADMSVPRLEATATLLGGGDVLVAGGQGNHQTWQTTELFHPATGTWTPGPILQTARSGHSATLLAPMVVLVAGGDSGKAVLDSCELVDATAARTSQCAPIPAPRFRQTATFLPDHTILLAGGQGAGPEFPILSSAIRYDPPHNRWLAEADMQAPRVDHVAALLPDGSVLLPNGVPRAGESSAGELFRPRDGNWDDTDAMPHPRLEAALAPVAGGVAVIGGMGQPAELAAPSRIVDIATWERSTPLE